MNTDYRPTNSWDFRLRAAKLGELMSVRSLEVWPESHWPGFALRQADGLQS